jgi:hypothetical protein
MALLGNFAGLDQPISILFEFVAVFTANLKHWQIIQLGKKRKNAPNVRNLSPTIRGVAYQK